MPSRRAFALVLLVAGAGALTFVVLSYVAASGNAGASAPLRDTFFAPGTGAFAVALILVGASMLKTPRDEAAPSGAPASEGATEPVGPVSVPPESLELEEGEVAACLNCGSRNLRFLPLGAGFFPEVECLHCHSRGIPMQFENTTGYRQFVKGLHEPPAREPARR